MTDAKHEEIRRLSSTLIEKNPKVFQPPLFSSNSVKEHVKVHLTPNFFFRLNESTYCLN